MKKSISPLLVFTGLLLANGLSADQQTHANTIDHSHPKFTCVTTTYKFDDGTQVEKTATEYVTGTSDTSKYKVVITKTIPGLVTYSLLTMGIQSIQYVVQITSAKDDSVDATFCLPAEGDTALGSKPKVFEVVPTNTITTQAGTVVDVDKIGFVGFSGKACTIEFVIVGRKVVGNTYWAKPGSPEKGHDNTPPN